MIYNRRNLTKVGRNMVDLSELITFFETKLNRELELKELELLCWIVERQNNLHQVTTA